MANKNIESIKHKNARTHISSKEEAGREDASDKNQSRLGIELFKIL